MMRQHSGISHKHRQFPGDTYISVFILRVKGDGFICKKKAIIFDTFSLSRNNKIFITSFFLVNFRVMVICFLKPNFLCRELSRHVNGRLA